MLRIMMRASPSFEEWLAAAYLIRSHKVDMKDVAILYQGIDAPEQHATIGLAPPLEDMTCLEIEASRHGFTPHDMLLTLMRQHDVTLRLIKRPYEHSFAWLAHVGYRDLPTSGEAARAARKPIGATLLAAATELISGLADPEVALAFLAIETRLMATAMDRNMQVSELNAAETQKLARSMPDIEAFRGASAKRFTDLPLPTTVCGLLYARFLQGSTQDLGETGDFYLARFKQVRDVIREKERDVVNRIAPVGHCFRVGQPNQELECVRLEVKSDHDASALFRKVTGLNLVITYDKRGAVPTCAIMAQNGNAHALSLVHKAFEVLNGKKDVWAFHTHGKMHDNAQLLCTRTNKDENVQDVLDGLAHVLSQIAAL